MIRGQQVFVKHFEDFKDCYIVIGGLAMDNILTEESLTARATKDFDIILVIEALRPEFFNAFWDFIEAGKYARREKVETDRRYYRFTQPQEEDYPAQIELFAKRPDIIEERDGSQIIPLPADGDATSLSAILMDDNYYEYTKKDTQQIEGLTIASKGSLICLKAKAYLELSQRKADGESIGTKNIKKHKNDVFRIIVTLNGDESFDVPKALKEDLLLFIDEIRKNEEDLTGILKSMGIGSRLTSTELIEVIEKVFSLK